MAIDNNAELEKISLRDEFLQDFIKKTYRIAGRFEPLPDVYLEGEVDERANPLGAVTLAVHKELKKSHAVTWNDVCGMIEQATEAVSLNLLQRLVLEEGEKKPDKINPNSPMGRVLQRGTVNASLKELFLDCAATQTGNDRHLKSRIDAFANRYSIARVFEPMDDIMDELSSSRHKIDTKEEPSYSDVAYENFKKATSAVISANGNDRSSPTFECIYKPIILAARGVLYAAFQHEHLQEHGQDAAPLIKDALKQLKKGARQQYKDLQAAKDAAEDKRSQDYGEIDFT